MNFVQDSAAVLQRLRRPQSRKKTFLKTCGTLSKTSLKPIKKPIKTLYKSTKPHKTTGFQGASKTLWSPMTRGWSEELTTSTCSFRREGLGFQGVCFLYLCRFKGCF